MLSHPSYAVHNLGDSDNYNHIKRICKPRGAITYSLNVRTIVVKTYFTNNKVIMKPYEAKSVSITRKRVVINETVVVVE